MSLFSSTIPLLIVASLGNGVVHATPIPHTVVLDEKMFGNLNQKDVPSCVPPGSGDFGFGCGPTATVNSFVFLEKRYPTIYGGKLVPKQTGTPKDFNNDGKTDTYDDMAAIAELLATGDFMNTVNDKVTFRYGLMSGKEKYLEQKVEKGTDFEGRDSPDLTGVHPKFKKPTYVERKDPTRQFLEENLKSGEDIELLISQFDKDGKETFGHYLTLTNLKWTDQDMDGMIDKDENATIGVINPSGGTFIERPLFQKEKDGPLFTQNKDKTQEFQITVAVKESPKKKTPTPSQPTGQSAAGESRESLSFDAATNTLTLTPFELSSAYVTSLVGLLDPDEIDVLFSGDPILGATVAFEPFQFAGPVGDGQFLFFHPIGTDNTVTVIKDGDMLFSASTTSLIFDPLLTTPFYARLYNFQFNDAIDSLFLDELQTRLLDMDELPFDLFIDPETDFLALTNTFTTSATTPATAGIAQNGTPVPEPSTVALFGIGAFGMFGYGWRWVAMGGGG